jgi:hypothetical protein
MSASVTSCQKLAKHAVLVPPCPIYQNLALSNASYSFIPYKTKVQLSEEDMTFKITCWTVINNGRPLITMQVQKEHTLMEVLYQILSCKMNTN